MTDQTTLPGTQAEFWINANGQGAKWRTSRKPLTCSHGKRHEYHSIPAGSRYLDTAETFEGPFATLKICEFHANSPLDL